MRLITLFLFLTLAFVGCSSDSDSPVSPITPPGGDSGEDLGDGNGENDDTDQSPNTLLSILIGYLENSAYSLNEPLSFQNSTEKEVVIFEGLPMESTVLRFEKYFLNGQQVDEANLEGAETYCKLIIEAPLGSNGADHQFSIGELDLGQIEHSQNEALFLKIVLQQGLGNQFWVSCKNAFDGDMVESHLGTILNVEEQ